MKTLRKLLIDGRVEKYSLLSYYIESDSKLLELLRYRGLGFNINKKLGSLIYWLSYDYRKRYTAETEENIATFIYTLEKLEKDIDFDLLKSKKEGFAKVVNVTTLDFVIPLSFEYIESYTFDAIMSAIMYLPLIEKDGEIYADNSEYPFDKISVIELSTNNKRIKLLNPLIEL